MGTMMMGVADFPIETLKALKIHPDAQKKKKEQQAQKKAEQEAADSESASQGEALTPSISSKTSQSGTTTDATTSQDATPTTSRSGSTFNLQESLSRIQSPTSASGASSTMSSALQNKLEPTQSQASDKSRSNSTPGTPKNPKDPKEYIEAAMGTGQGVQKIVGAGFKSPMDFTMGLAKGFHNAPKLYGDDVRKAENVTDFRSGLKAAGKSFGYGMFDGITGLVSQPMKGAQKEGAAGFVKGIGKGIGGIVLKPGAAVFGIPGYTMKGVYKELQRQMGSSVQNYIIAARTAQGYEEWSAASAEERADVVRRWGMLQQGLRNKKDPEEVVREIFEESRRKRAASVVAQGRGGQGGGAESTSASAPLTTMAQADELEDAIRRSVQETSRGDPDEDAAIERAIRASMNELARSGGGGLQHSSSASNQQQGKDDDDKDEDMRRAMEASVQQSHQDGLTSGRERDDELEQALAASLKEQRGMRETAHDDDDEEYRRAVEESRQAGGDAGHLSGTTREAYETEREEKGGGEKSKQELDEENVVLEYVKKQSLLEEKHRGGVKGESSASGQGKGEEAGEDDEELRRAMEMSMREQGK